MRSLIVVLLLFSFSLTASTISPELEKRLRSEGKWNQYITLLHKAKIKGVNAPNKQAPDLKKIMAQNKNTTYLNALVILVQFNDHLADTTNHDSTAFNYLLFSENTHPYGSMNDYYLENSYGKTGVKGVTTKWFTMPQNYAYYVNGQAGFGSYPNNAQKLVEDAIAAADPYVDFSDYDNDNDGYVDALFVVHAGIGRESSGSDDDIHSHAWGINAQYRDGVIVSGYSMEPELHTHGQMVHMGVFGHEFGHVLGLPDLYDTDYSSRGVGRWSMMAGGSWNNNGNTPSQFDAWSKYTLGWINPVIIKNDTTNVEIRDIEGYTDSFILWTEGLKGTEYFLVENRQQMGFDSYIPGHGMVVYHVDETMSGNTGDWHPLVMIEQADGLFDLQNNNNSGDAKDPFPGSLNITSFEENGSPNSNAYSGDNTAVRIMNIQENNDIITADFYVNVSYPILSMGQVSLSDSSGDGENDADPGETVKLSFMLDNVGAGSDSVLVYLSSDDTNLVWQDSLQLIDSLQRDESVFLKDAFSVHFKDSMTDPSYVIIDVNISYQNGDFYDYMTVLVGDNPGFISNMEGDPRIWRSYPVTLGYSDEWHIENLRNHTSGGQYSFKVGGTGTANYSDLLDAALESPEIELGPDNNAVLTFYQIVYAEDENGTNTAWDGGLVELSADNGQNWEIIYPLSGYPYSIINNPDSPFNAKTPVFSGTVASWQKKTFDLSAYSGVVKIRFRFGSDAYVTEEGWYIDDVAVQTFPTGIVRDAEGQLPDRVQLFQNYPNPFNPETSISFRINQPGRVKIAVYDLTGRMVKELTNRDYDSGNHTLNWAGKDENGLQVASGVYFYKLETADFIKTRKMILLR